MIKVIFALLGLVYFAHFTEQAFADSDKPTRNISSETVGGAPAEEPVAEADDDSEPTMEEIAASRGDDPHLSQEQQDAAYAVKLCEQDPFSCIQQASNGVKIKAQLVKRKGKYMFEVFKNGSLSYSCLASPGKGGKTPRNLDNITPVATEKLHVVTGRKKYKGHKMPNVVWLRGDYAVHGSGTVTGRRESHGCIRIACDLKFYNDVKATGVGNVKVSVIDN